MKKITIIGTGSVGSTIAYTLATNGIASEIVMVDINHERALGEVMDIKQALPFCHPVNMYAGKYDATVDSDIVIITSGVPRKPGQSRLDLAQTNVNVIKSIAPEITKYAPNAIYIIVSNPVDVLTYVFNKVTDIPAEHIIGSGTLLDTSRLRTKLSEIFNIGPSNIHAYVLGEHGDSSFIPWSICDIPGVDLENFSDPEKPEFDKNAIAEYVKKSGAYIIERKGATFYAVAVSVCYICKAIFGGVDTIMTVSSMMNGEFGISDVCLSTLNMVGGGGAVGKVLCPMKPEEEALLARSAENLRRVIDSLDI